MHLPKGCSPTCSPQQPRFRPLTPSLFVFHAESFSGSIPRSGYEATGGGRKSNWSYLGPVFFFLFFAPSPFSFSSSVLVFTLSPHPDQRPSQSADVHLLSQRLPSGYSPYRDRNGYPISPRPLLYARPHPPFLLNRVRLSAEVRYDVLPNATIAATRNAKLARASGHSVGHFLQRPVRAKVISYRYPRVARNSQTENSREMAESGH